MPQEQNIRDQVKKITDEVRAEISSKHRLTQHTMISASMTEEKIEKETWSEFNNKLKIAGIEILSHTLVTLMCLASITVVHYALKYLLGDDAKLFDYLKVKYLIDAADIVVLIRLVLVLVKDTFNSLMK